MRPLKTTFIILLFATNGFAQSLYFSGMFGFDQFNGPMTFSNPNGSNSGTAFSLLLGVPVYKQKINLELEYSHLSSGFKQGNGNSIGEYSINRSELIPAVKVYFGQTKFSLYARFGIVIDFPGIREQDRIYAVFDTIPQTPNANTPDIHYTTSITQGNYAYGIKAGVGYNYKLIPSVSAFIELNYTGIHWTPTHSEVTEATGGVNLANFTIAQKQIDYLQFPTIYVNPAQPSQQLAPSNSFESYGLTIGITFYLGRIRN
jgi:hypothetical protein